MNVVGEGTESETAYRLEAERARQAEELLSSPIFAEACNRIDAELRISRESVPMSDSDMHTRLILTEQLWSKLLDYLKAVMEGGAFARQQLKLRESRSEHIMAAVKRGVRL